MISKKHCVFKILGLRELPAADGEKKHCLVYKYFKFPFLKAPNSDFLRLRRAMRGNKFSMVGTRCNEIRLCDVGQSQKSYPQIISYPRNLN